MVSKYLDTVFLFAALVFFETWIRFLGGVFTMFFFAAFVLFGTWIVILGGLATLFLLETLMFSETWIGVLGGVATMFLLETLMISETWIGFLGGVASEFLVAASDISGTRIKFLGGVDAFIVAFSSESCSKWFSCSYTSNVSFGEPTVTILWSCLVTLDPRLCFLIEEEPDSRYGFSPDFIRFRIGVFRNLLALSVQLLKLSSSFCGVMIGVIKYKN